MKKKVPFVSKTNSNVAFAVNSFEKISDFAICSLNKEKMKHMFTRFTMLRTQNLKRTVNNFRKNLPWPKETCGSKLSFYLNIVCKKYN